MTYPKLKKGDRIAIAAPSRKVELASIAPAIHLLEDRGYRVSVAPNLNSAGHNYLAGADDERLNALQAFIDDPEVKAIFAVRGGYGVTRVLEHLDFSLLQKHPKWIVGFSDITALHLKLATINLKSIHGTMPLLFSKPDASTSFQSAIRVLETGKTEIKWTSGSPEMFSVSGHLIGGNLSLICDALGTPSEPNCDGAILVIEEIDEPRYKIDRMLQQLRRAGKFNSLRALLVGHMTAIKDGELAFGEDVLEMAQKLGKEFNFPVLTGFPSGHENPNLAWIHGAVAKLQNQAGNAVLISE